MKVTIPKNWKANSHKHISKWMDKLPPVYNLKETLENDEIWENKTYKK